MEKNEELKTVKKSDKYYWIFTVGVIILTLVIVWGIVFAVK